MVKRLYQLARYCTVGLLCFALSLGLLVCLHEYAHVQYLIAFAATFIVCCAVGYLLNARFTFTSGETGLAGAARYTLVNLTALVLNLLALKLLVEGAHLWYLGATVLLAAINAPISFAVHRIISYRAALPLAARK
jgi:putative flippase GtrA